MLADNPSLTSEMDEYSIKSYKKAVREAVSETGLDDSLFPTECECSMTKILSDEFFPN